MDIKDGSQFVRMHLDAFCINDIAQQFCTGLEEWAHGELSIELALFQYAQHLPQMALALCGLGDLQNRIVEDQDVIKGTEG